MTTVPPTPEPVVPVVIPPHPAPVSPTSTLTVTSAPATPNFFASLFTGVTSNLTVLEGVLTAVLAAQAIIVQLVSSVPAAARIVASVFGVLSVLAVVIKNFQANQTPSTPAH